MNPRKTLEWAFLFKLHGRAFAGVDRGTKPSTVPSVPSVWPQVEVGFWLSFLSSQIQGQMRDLPLNLRPRGKAFASRGRDNVNSGSESTRVVVRALTAGVQYGRGVGRMLGPEPLPEGTPTTTRQQ